MSKIEVELQETMGSDESVAAAAWTSTYNFDRRELKLDDPEMVAHICRRVVREGHSVPIESVELRFWIRMPTFTDRQHMTHRMASHNGLSGRYRTIPDDFMELPNDVAAIFDKVSNPNGTKMNGSEEWLSHKELLEGQHLWYLERLQKLRDAERRGEITNPEYKRAREVLRGVVGTAYMTERVTKLNLGSFANYQRLRNSPHAQREIREVAQRMLSAVIAKRVAPVTMGALMDKGWLVGEPNHEWSEWEHD